MSRRIKKFSIAALASVLAVALVCLAWLPAFTVKAKDGDLTERLSLPTDFVGGQSELTVGYTQGEGFTLNGEPMGSLYEKAFELSPGNEYIALHVFTGADSPAGVQITEVTVSGKVQDLSGWTNYAGEAGQVSADSITVSGTNLSDATVVSSAVSYENLAVTLKLTGNITNLTRFSIQYGTSGSLYYANFEMGEERICYISGAIPEEPETPRDNFNPEGIFSNYAAEKLVMTGQPYGVLIGNKPGVNAVWGDTIGYVEPVSMANFNVKADIVGGSEWNNNRNIVIQTQAGDLVIREYGNGWGQVLYNDTPINVDQGSGNAWITSNDQSELDISVTFDGKKTTITNNCNGNVIATSEDIVFTTATDGTVNSQANLFFKFENVTVTDRTMGLLVREINGKFFQGEEIEVPDISEWEYWDPATEPDYELFWRNEGAVPTCVKGGIAVRGTDKGWQKYIYSNYGRSTLQGYDSISDFSAELHAVTPDKLDGVDFVLRSAGGQMIALRITDAGSTSSYGVTVYSYSDNGYPILGSLSDIPADIFDRGTFLIEWDYDGTGIMKLNGHEIPINSSQAYPNGYKDFRWFTSSNAQIAFGIFEDSLQYENSMVVLTSVNGKELPEYTPQPNVDYVANWKAETGVSIENTAEGLLIKSEGNDVRYAVYGDNADVESNTVKHNVSDFSIKVKISENITAFIVRLSGQNEDKQSIAAYLRFTAEDSLFEIVDESGEVLAEVQNVPTADGEYEIAFSCSEKTASINGVVTVGDLSCMNFRFMNAKLSVGVSGTAGASIIVCELGGEELKYYVAVPNFEREYAEGETIVDDFSLDEWMAAGVSVSASDKSVDFTFRSTEAGMWYEVPLQYTESALNASSDRSYLSMYFSCNSNITLDGGVRISIATRAGNQPTGAITSALSIRIAGGGTTVAVYNANWNSLASAPTTIIGEFSESGGFLIEFDNAAKTLYVNGTQIAGSFSSFNFPDNGTFIGIFGTGSEAAPGVLSLKKVNNADLIAGAQNEMIQFSDPDEQRVQDQLQWVEKNGDATIDYQQEMNASRKVITETVTERVYDGMRLTTGGIIGIGVGSLVAIAAVVCIVVIIRKKKKV